MKTSITLSALKHMLDANRNVILLDVRSKEEYAEQHIPGATNLPIEIIESGAFSPERGKIIITVCGKGGGRSERAAKYLREHSAETVYFLEGGTFGWMGK